MAAWWTALWAAAVDVRCATTDPVAKQAIAAWLAAVANVAPQCPTARMNVTFAPDALARSPPWKPSFGGLFAYRNVPKAGTNTLGQWFKACEADFADMQHSDVRPLRVSAVREPVSRALSGYAQLMEEIKKLTDFQAADEVEACYLHKCPWVTTSTLKLRVRDSRHQQESLLALVRTDFYQRSIPFNGSAAELYRALQLGAQIYGPGCGQRTVFAGEHLRPIYTLTRGEADFSFRIEHMEEDQRRFLALLHAQGGTVLNQSGACAKEIGKARNVAANKPRTPGHSFDKENILEDARATGVTKKVLRAVCAIYMVDFLCSGYELPPPCAATRKGGAVFPWLEESLRELLVEGGS